MSFFGICSALFSQALFRFAEPTDVSVDVVIAEIPLRQPSMPAQEPAPEPAPNRDPTLARKDDVSPIGRIVHSFQAAHARVSTCRILSGEPAILNSAWDGHNIVCGASRIAEIAFHDGHISNFSIDELWVRVTATACFCIALKFNSRYAFERLQLFARYDMTCFTTIYYCLFAQSEVFSQLESDMRGLHSRIEAAESHLTKRLKDILFRLMFFTPSNTVEVYLSNIGGCSAHEQFCIYVRNVAAYAAVLSHITQDNATALVRKSTSPEAVGVVSSAMLLVACEAIVVQKHASELPLCIIPICAKELQNKQALTLAISVANLLVKHAGQFSPVIVRQRCDAVCKRLVDVDIMLVVHRNILRQLRTLQLQTQYN
jgi:hypothetical protein